MINNSKILTVSYGTFSCTLEGFDDSFTTMKAIAEYFRDLAADDRYFGAEPPTPDAEMLARIAEREIERRVEAHEANGKIVLRAEEAAPAALLSDAADSAQPDVTTTDSPDEQNASADLTAKAPEPAPQADLPVVEEQQTEEPVAAPKSEGFTAPMPARDTAPSAPEATVEATADVDDDTGEHSQDIATPDESVEDDSAEPEVAEVAEHAEAPVQAADEPAEDTEPDTLADFADEAEDMGQPASAAAEISHPDPDSVAAKLSRIRSVVAQSEQPYADTAYSEDEHANDFLQSNLAELDAALAADDEVELNAVQETVEDEAETLAETVQAEEVEPEAPVEAEENIVSEQYDDSDILSNISAQTNAADEAPEPEEASAPAPLELTDSDLVQTEAEAVDDTLSQLLADAMPESDAQDLSEAMDDVEDERPLNARVMKMKSSELDAALASGALQDAPAEQGQDTVNLFSDDDGVEIESSLSAEEEAELQRELAAVEADFASDDDLEAESVQVAEEEAELDDEGDAVEAKEEVFEAEAHSEPEYDDDEVEELHAESDDDEEMVSESDDEDQEDGLRGVDRLQAVEQTSDVSRIFDEADQQRDSPDSSERRNAIQHLRAAVAATRADQNAGVDISKHTDDSAYRSDLADVVRPRRPRAATTNRSARPGTERPAPLKLVAEQRIDTPKDPVRPRRITTTDIADMEPPEMSDTDGNFAEFAAEMGASSLPELLEAAAAYMADVEGRPQFSRPMLMGKLKEVEGDAFSREDGLRSFGQLLRQGKLQKLKGGRFAVTDQTDYRGEARNAS